MTTTIPTRISVHIEKAYIHLIPPLSIEKVLSEDFSIDLFSPIISAPVYELLEDHDQDMSNGVESHGLSA